MSSKSPEIRFNGFTDDWEERKLGEVGYFYYGKSAPKWSVTEDAETPCVRYGELYTKYGAKISNIYSHTNINPKNLKFSTGNEVLVPRVGENPLDFSLCSWLSIPNVAIGEMISVYNTNENPLFISYYFRGQMKYEFAKRVEGGNVSNLYYSYLEDIDLYIPKLEEQIAISKFFENLDDTIALHQRELDNLIKSKKGFLQKMFPKKGKEAPELRFSEFTKDWETVNLGHLVKIATGKLDANAMVQEGIYDFYTSGIKKYKIDVPAFKGPAITIAGNGATVGYMHYADGEFNAYQRTYVLTDFKANREFLYQEIGRKLPKKIKEEARTGNIPYIVMDMLTDLKTELPSAEEQIKIGRFFQQLEKEITCKEKKLELLKKAKKAFLQKMFV